MTESIQTAMPEATGRDSLGRAASPLLFPIRLAIGAVQGLALWALYKATETGPYVDDMLPPRDWPASEPTLFAPLVLVFLFVPVLLLAGVSRMRPRTLAIWAVAATAALALLGWHDVARQSAETLRYPPFFTAPLFLFSAAALFIGHHLILPADLERRWVAAFPTYFDTAWKAGVQLGLSIGFTGAFWLLLLLGSELFKIIGLPFLSNLIAEEWFTIPLTCLVFPVAVHLTDVRDGLIRGVRTVVLMLLSWLLLVMTVLVAGFLVALPFTGLDGLWNTGSATALVLSAAAALIILINTAYQDGRPDNLPPAVLRIAVRVAAVLITPLVILAFWGLALRIGQHGLTPDRIIALACAVVGLAHAVGYVYAALRPFWQRDAAWMTPLERTNISGAILAAALILVLFSPLADPTRLSVNDQVARLERGAVTVEGFDFRFLRFESGKAGLAALDELSRSTTPSIAQRAKNVIAASDRFEDAVTGAQARRPVFAVWPSAAALPEGFLTPVDSEDSRYHCTADDECAARPIDLDDDGIEEVLVANTNIIRIWTRQPDGVWVDAGAYRTLMCGTDSGQNDHRIWLRSSDLRPVAPSFPDLDLGGGRRASPEGVLRCPADEAIGTVGVRPQVKLRTPPR
ncbi:DUF4153 domain-containing protein [uncultured Brevundimonas sp.]|uniref:DUF4153 domain-containing protein n=1 Tax=uncultured Brevundimonas sp. TaxID=213418 RepID=UPI0025D560D4|nr:DUF4153 domain-containing protein [uncultured Brevundimonas sp.]